MEEERRDRGGARHLARLHGTEEDRSNCPFFYKVGACRHTERCQRKHEKPAFSCTVLLPHLWNNPEAEAEANPQYRRKSRRDEDDEFKEFFEDVFGELAKFGEIEDFVVCENVSEHMVGHVFVKFFDEEDAQKCVEGMVGRYYAGKSLTPEFSPVSDFSNARCRQFSTRKCSRGLKCNFSHTRLLPDHDRFLGRQLENQPFAGKRSRHLHSSRRRSRG